MGNQSEPSVAAPVAAKLGTFNWKILGPGLLFAATSVGTSHLVQSTRAGALYGLGLLLIVIVANAIKYPAFRFASDYYPATGNSLLEAYRKQGRGVLICFSLIAVVTLLFGVSALSLMSAGLIKVVFNLSWSTPLLAISLIVITAVVLVVGHYKTLERITKVLVMIMMACTLVATFIVLPDVEWGGGLKLLPTNLDLVGVMFIAALIGWMPVPLDASVWQSLWAKAKSQSSSTQVSPKESRLDFNIGFIGTVILAICFLLMGAGLMHGKEIELASGSAAFSAQLIGLYETVLGSFAGPVIGVAALAIIYSSLLTLMDAYPRTLTYLVRRFKGIPESKDKYVVQETGPVYLGVLVFMLIGAITTYSFYLSSLTSLLDLGATVAFCSAPLIAYFNHKAITGSEVPISLQPSRAFRRYSAISITLMTAFALCYIYLRFLS